MKERQHDFCAGCAAYSTSGFTDDARCELGYRQVRRGAGMATYMDGPGEPCFHPGQRRTLAAARLALLTSGRRVEAFHCKGEAAAESILVKPEAKCGKDYPEFYRVKKTKA